MKALILQEYNRFSYEEVPTPEPGEGEVLIQVKACGICGSDVHGMDGSTGRRQPPIIMGHEASGIIAEFGKNVTGWSKGDRVTFDSTVYCSKCLYCRRGQINLCDNRMVLGVSCNDYLRHGAFAEYVAVPQHILYALPEKVTFPQAAMTEALSIAFHAVRRTSIALNDIAVVVGAGMIGLLVIESLYVAGCGKIIAIDIDADRLSLACKLGADSAINAANCDAAAEVLKLTGDRGADIAFEVVGMTSTLRTAMASLRKGGCLTLVGNISPKVELALQSVVTREISIYGSCASCGEYPACLDMMSRGQIDVNSLISVVAPLSEGAEWFKRLYNKEKGLIKVILEP
jgi:L-iditol 2-dehydrogenase